MRTIAFIGTAVVVLAVAGCASPAADQTAPDTPVPTGAAVQAQLAELPTPDLDSAVLAVSTVLEQSSGDLLCVGPVAESAPPQCSGLELLGWDWDAIEHQETDGVRWAQGIAIEGVYQFEPQSFFATGEPMSAAAITLPAIEIPAGELDEPTIEAVQADLATIERVDILGARGQEGIVVLDVIWDDGRLQEAVNAVYGDGVVFVLSALRPSDPPEQPTTPVPPRDTAVPVITGAEAQASLAELPTPSATEPVIAVGTVLEAASGALAGTPVLCNNVHTSLPPQCGGPAVVGWDWSAVEHEERSGVRWIDSVAMRATYDAATNALTPAEMLDRDDVAIPEYETMTGTVDAATEQAVQEDLHSLGRADVMGSGTGTGVVTLEVVYDDGSMQAWLDEYYGLGVVHVWSWLQP
ncbi:hypothetical protein [Agrococcus sp. ARC_14]|uniref:hypothetical protein n=1 Tax=Agrococcus sp. ARC_14 TaxID=2919927 RepID=UPI001F058CA9|nr:hypothetical protein [Agrococcus sp. ARC_14]MCH1882739.1 hypothetical protein [Agrococcus sp. ARC_14]